MVSLLSPDLLGWPTHYQYPITSPTKARGSHRGKQANKQKKNPYPTLHLRQSFSHLGKNCPAENVYPLHYNTCLPDGKDSLRSHSPKTPMHHLFPLLNYGQSKFKAGFFFRFFLLFTMLLSEDRRFETTRKRVWHFFLSKSQTEMTQNGLRLVMEEPPSSSYPFDVMIYLFCSFTMQHRGMSNCSLAYSLQRAGKNKENNVAKCLESIHFPFCVHMKE